MAAVRPASLYRYLRPSALSTGRIASFVTVLLAAWLLLQWQFRAPAGRLALSVVGAAGTGVDLSPRLSVELIPGPLDAESWNGYALTARFHNGDCRTITILRPPDSTVRNRVYPTCSVQVFGPDG